MVQVKTPKGIMYLLSMDDTHAYCYDDQTGNEEVFLISEILPLKQKRWASINI
jgi:hypothetical protein